LPATFIARRGLAGGDAQETLGLFDATSPIAVVAHNVTANTVIWTDLGSGIAYGSSTLAIQ